MRKLFLIIIGLLILNFGYAQKAPASKKTVPVNAAAKKSVQAAPPKKQEETQIVLGGKPAGKDKCFSMEDFQNKLDIQGFPKADSVNIEIVKIIGKRASGFMVTLYSLQELQKFSLADYITNGFNISDPEQKERAERINLTPGRPFDRILVYAGYKVNGKWNYKAENFWLCKP